MLKKSICIISSLLVLFFFSCSAKEDSKEEKVKVLAIMPLTGTEEEIGKEAKKSFTILEEKLKKENIEVVYFDSGLNSISMEQDLRKAINKDEIKALVMCTRSENSKVITKISEESEILVINPLVITKDITASNNCYSICYSDEFEADGLAKFTRERLKLTRVAVLFNEEDIYSNKLASYYKYAYEASGGKMIDFIPHKIQDSYSSIVNKLKGLNVDGVFIPDHSFNFNSLVKEAKIQGINAKFIGGNYAYSNSLKEEDYMEGVYFSTAFTAEKKSPDILEFKKLYEGKFSAMPSDISALTYDAVNILVDVFSNGEQVTTLDKQKALLEKLNFKGVTGTISFKKHKSLSNNLVIYSLRNKQIFIEYNK